MANLSQAAGKKSLYISSNKYAAVAGWQAGHAYSVGDVCRPTGISLGITLTQAAPGVFTWRDNGGTALTHNFQTNDLLIFGTNSDALPTNLVVGTPYFVKTPSGSTFNLVTAWNGATGIDTTAGSNTGTHKATCINYRYALCYVCIVAGTSAASLEPVWPTHIDSSTTRGGNVVDGGTLKWMEVTGCAILNGDLTGTPTWTEGGKPGYQCYGQVITNDAQTYVFICTTNNVAAAGTEPSWNTTTGATTTDGSASWTCLGSVASWQARMWASPFDQVAKATNPGWGDGTNGGTVNFLIGNSHHGIYTATGFGWYARGSPYGYSAKYTCINEGAASLPPASTDVTTGAIEETVAGGSYYPTTGNNVKCYGIQFLFSFPAFGSQFEPGAGWFEQCKFFHMGVGGINPQNLCEWKNCQVKFGSTSGWVSSNNSTTTGMWLWHNDDVTMPGIAAGGTSPTHLGLAGGTIVGVDLATNFTGDLVYWNNGGSPYQMTLRRCKVNSGALSTAASFNYTPGQRFRVIDCDNGAFYNHCELWGYEGFMTTDRVGYKAGGASIQSSPYSWKLLTQYATTADPWISLPISAYNSNIATTVTVTVYGCTTGALPTNDEMWLDVDFLGTTYSPLATFVSGRCLTLATPANLSTDTSDWTGVAGARANSHAYVLGDELSIASTGGNRLFVCTTAGTSAGSLPGGYATATDGSAITDGGAVFTAVRRFTITLSLTPYPLVSGPINAVIRVANNATAKTYWFDPMLNLS